LKTKKLGIIIILAFLIVLSINAQEEIEPSYVLKIVSSDLVNINENEVILNGSVELNFTSLEENAKILKADRIILNIEEKTLIAYNNVSFTSEDNDNQKIEADVVYYNWETGNIKVLGGEVESQRENSEGQTISFYAKGDSLSYLGNSEGFLLEQGRITTSQDDPYFSIDSSDMAILDEGDMFIRNATIKLGRVKLYYFPFFFYPGTTFVFNPAFGYSSTNGFFFNTTTELYGLYPIKENEDQSSFATLLNSDNGSEKVKDGLVYSSSKTLDNISDLEKWARESDSYFALFADSYEEQGSFIGFQSENNLYNDILQISAQGGIAYDIKNETLPFRGFFDLQANLSLQNSSFELNFPYFSDSTVKSDYFNRLNTYSFDSFLNNDQSFPSDYSTVTSYEVSFEGNWKPDVSALSPLITSFEISKFDFMGLYEYQKVDDEYTYVLDNYSPEINMELKGTLFDIKKTVENEKIENPVYTDLYALQLNNELQNLDKGEPFLLDVENSSLIEDRYLSSPITSETSEVINKYALKYEISQNFSEIDYESENEQTIEYILKEVLDFNLDLGSSWLSITNQLKPYYYKYVTEDDDIDKFTLKNVFSLNSNKLGLTYNLSETLINFYSSNSEITDEYFEFDEDSTSIHNIVFSKDIKLFNFSFTQNLPPLTQYLTPKVKYNGKYFNFETYIKLAEGEDNLFQPSWLNFNSGLTFEKFDFNILSSIDLDDEDIMSSFSLDQDFSYQLFNEFVFYEKASFVDEMEFDELELALKYKESFVSLSFKDSSLNLDVLNVDLNFSDFQFDFYKKRGLFNLNLDLNFKYDFSNKYASVFGLELDSEFYIAEFLALKISVESENNGFYNYYVDDVFSYNLMFKDLLNSFDFFSDGQEGRDNTSFNLKSLNFDFVHYMKDWDLHCKYNASVVLSEGVWTWEPTFTILLQWKDIPELKVERNEQLY